MLPNRTVKHMNTLAINAPNVVKKKRYTAMAMENNASKLSASEYRKVQDFLVSKQGKDLPATRMHYSRILDVVVPYTMMLTTDSFFESVASTTIATDLMGQLAALDSGYTMVIPAVYFLRRAWAVCFRFNLINGWGLV
jgi:hypothetical protein